MRFLVQFALLLGLAALISVPTYAQRSTKRTAKPAATPKTTLPPLEVRTARVSVSNQLSNVGAFISRLGPIGQSIEAVDAEARTRKLSQASIDSNEVAKQKVVAAIRGLREGLLTLETDFRTKPALKRYLPTLEGIALLAGEAEDAAIAGRFTAANAPLRSVQQKLNDTLAVMPAAGSTIVPARVTTPAASTSTRTATTTAAAGQVNAGMTTAQVRTILGTPRTVNKSVTARGTAETWIYDKRQVVFNESGRVTSVREL